MIIERQPGPVEQQAILLLDRVGAVGHNGDRKISLSQLIVLLGADSHLVVLLVFCILNMIPGPPGFGGSIAIATFSFALAMVLDRPIRLPAFVGNRQVPLAPLLKMLERLLLVSRKLNRISQPRAEFLTGPTARRVIGGCIMVVCTVMVVPIPFINAVP
ncbi:MAG TPA: exopolysaccharide biosynthesis protein, partial [Devosia sp.]|nr:exopolysaccharide biosynthesis protein [Devosia sp.]